MHTTRGEPPTPDAPGYDLKPDLDTVRTWADLTAAMRDFRIWAGEPSYRQMAANCGQLLSWSAIYRALASDRPTVTAVQATIRGCGGTEDDEAQFVKTWVRVNANTRWGEPVSKPASEPLRTIPAYTYDSNGTLIEIAYTYLLNFHHEGRQVDDPGGVSFTLTSEENVMAVTVEPEEALRIADRIRDTANIAIAAREHGAAPDGVPAEWTESQ